MGVMLDGRAESMRIKARLTARVSRIPQGAKPELSVVLVGNNPASETYVTIKKRFGETVGVNVKIHRITNQELRITNQPKYLRQLIQHLNRSKKVHGILLQLPLPRGFNAQEHIDLIDRKKDVDGLCRDSFMKSPVAEAVRHLLEIGLRNHKIIKSQNHNVIASESRSEAEPRALRGGWVISNVDIRQNEIARLDSRQSRQASSAAFLAMTDQLKGVLLVKSDEFARSLLKSLSTFPVEWKVERVTSRDMRSHVSTMRMCDIVISALGFPHAITSNMIKRGAVIIDVGFTKSKDDIMGDVHPDCYEKSSFYSPVPGGVGPLTVAYVFKNLMKLWKLSSL